MPLAALTDSELVRARDTLDDRSLAALCVSLNSLVLVDLLLFNPDRATAECDLSVGGHLTHSSTQLTHH